jgi:RNA recognition motif-containing protein
MALRVNNLQVSPDTKSLWMGEIEPWMDEIQISGLFTHIAQTVGVKIIKDKMTGLPAGYGFVEFDSHEAAKKVLETLNGTPIQGMHKYGYFR